MAETQFDRERMLLGDEAMQVLAASHVAVFGVGGVGSFAAEALARAGVGAITLIDHDTVSLTNLNRQLVALHSTIGMRKTDVMASRILDINPACRVTNLPVFYEPECREDFFSRGFDYIADCIDSTRSKLDLIETAIRRGVPIISSMGTGNRLDPSKFRITDLSKTSGCPLAKVMRRELRKRGIKKLKVVYSTEPPIEPKETEELSCKNHCVCPPGTARKCTVRRQIPGSTAFVPSVAGLIIAGEVVKDLIKDVR